MNEASSKSLSPLVGAKKAAELLNVSVGTLAVWRCTGRVNLPYIKIGRSVKYRVGDNEEHAAQ